MPAYEFAFPVGITVLKLLKRQIPYDLVVGTHTFTRTGKDGAETILALFGGDEFNGEVLEGQWIRGCDAGITGFLAKIDGAGALNMGGVAAVAGTYGYGWMSSQLPCPLIDQTEISFEMEVPVADTGAVANRDFTYSFYLTKNKNTSYVIWDTDLLQFRIGVTDAGFLFSILKLVAGGWTHLFDGATYVDGSARDPSTTNLFLILRVVIHESHYGTLYRHMHVYLKQSDSYVNVEASPENELTTSPYNISNLQFQIAFPAFDVETENTTYLGVGYRAISQFVRVSHPDFDIKYDVPEANIQLGECKVFDTMNSATETDWQRVRDAEHIWVGKQVVRNGFIEVLTDLTNTAYGFGLAYWTGAAWSMALSIMYNQTDNPYIVYLSWQILAFKSITSEKVVFTARNYDSTTMDYIDFIITLERGKYYLQFEVIDCFPHYANGMIYGYYRGAGGGAIRQRFGFFGDGYVGDNNLPDWINNLTVSDNIEIQVDPTNEAMLSGLFVMNNKPSIMGRYSSFLSFQEYVVPTIPGSKFGIYAIPFATYYANVFKEAESATLTNASRLYLGASGEDSCTENQAVWAATTNCAVVTNDATAGKHPVGSFDTRITSSAAGAVLATCTPTTVLGKLTKFDTLKVYLSRSVTLPTSIEIRLRKDAGNYVSITQAITATMTQFSIPIPHSATDLQGWTQTGTMVFTGFATLTIGWTAAAAGEIVYVDGLHEFIDITTTRGRGELLSTSAVVLDAQNEKAQWNLTGVTSLPIGRYMALIRMKDVDQVASDLRMGVYNSTDARYMSEDSNFYKTGTSAFAYYKITFDVVSADSGDTYGIYILKDSATENTIFVDYFVIFPIGNSQSFPHDIAHNALRTVIRNRIVGER